MTNFGKKSRSSFCNIHAVMVLPSALLSGASMTFRDMSVWVGCFLVGLTAIFLYLNGLKADRAADFARADAQLREAIGLSQDLSNSVTALFKAATLYLDTGNLSARNTFHRLRQQRDKATTDLVSPFLALMRDAPLLDNERTLIEKAFAEASLLSTRQFAATEMFARLQNTENSADSARLMRDTITSLSGLRSDVYATIASYDQLVSTRFDRRKLSIETTIRKIGDTLSLVFVAIQLSFVASLGYFAYVVLPGYERIREALYVTVYENTDAPVIGISRRDEVGDMARAVMTLRDISRRRLDRLYRLAYFDTLTGLANRAVFRTRLGELLKRSGGGGCLAVYMLDLDKFKEINDLYGHPAGDIVLLQTARRLKETVGNRLLPCRFGGDEFGIVGVLASEEEAVAFGDTLLQRISQPTTVSRSTVVTCGGTIGLATATSMIEPDRIISQADMALYSAKEAGRGHLKQFVAGMDARIKERRYLEEDLRKADMRNELKLALQPQMCLRSDKIIGFEALMRWNHPVRGNVSPNIFIPIAEESRLIVSIGRWSILEACRIATKWPQPVKISINLSPAQFYDKGLVPFVIQTLDQTGIAPERVEIELTETVLIDNRATAFRIMHELRAIGVELALDDFGTGFSSLSYLREFPFDKIKIDQSFVRVLEEGGTARAIIRSMIGLGNALGMKVIAEGVETEEQRAILVEDGCDQIQGYLIGKAMSTADATHLLSEGRLSTMEAFEADRLADQLSAPHEIPRSDNVA